MHAVSYLNSNMLVPSSTTNSALSSTEKHPLQLADADRIDITQQFLRHLAQARLSACGSRLALAVFSQTLDFNKLEDDMNGRRLQQLTDILPNHANANIRNLTANHILIARKGKFGQYLSINFNFAQWGQAQCDTAPCNNPSMLLDTEYEPYLDQAQPVQVEQSSESELLDKIDKTNKALQHDNVDLHHLHDLLTTLTTKVTQIETQWNDLSNHNYATKPLINNATIIEFPVRTTATINFLSDTNTLTTEPSAFNHSHDDHKLNQPNKLSELNEPSAIADTVTEITEQTSTETTPIPQLEMKNIATKTAITGLEFPPQFSADDCQHAEKLLQKAGDEAQLLLNMLRQRLTNTADPVRDPFAYLGGLLRRLGNNQLDRSIPVSTVTFDPAKPKPVSALKQCEDDFREAAADCKQMETNIKRLADQAQLNFQEYIQKCHMKEMWEATKNRFMMAKEALSSVQEGVTVAA